MTISFKAGRQCRSLFEFGDASATQSADAAVFDHAPREYDARHCWTKLREEYLFYKAQETNYRAFLQHNQPAAVRENNIRQLRNAQLQMIQICEEARKHGRHTS